MVLRPASCAKQVISVADLDDQDVADIIWATNSAEYFELLTQRGWSPRQFGNHLIDLWTRALLEPSTWT